MNIINCLFRRRICNIQYLYCHTIYAHIAGVEHGANAIINNKQKKGRKKRNTLKQCRGRSATDTQYWL